MEVSVSSSIRVTDREIRKLGIPGAQIYHDRNFIPVELATLMFMRY